MTIEQQTLGQRIGHYRRQAGYRTPADLVATLPEGTLTTATLQNIESGRKKQVSIGELLILARAMRMLPVTLVADPRDPMGPSKVDGLSNWEAIELLYSHFAGPNTTDVEERQVIQWINWLMTVRRQWDDEVRKAREDEITGNPIGDPWYLVEALHNQAVAARARLLEDDIDVSWAHGPWFDFTAPASGRSQRQ